MAVPFVALPAFGAPEESPHPFTGFNKPPKETASTLVGNWVEERALKDATGTARYESWVDQGEPTSIYATRQDQAALGMATHPRVIEHLNQTAPQNWKTMHQVSYKPHSQASPLLDFKPAGSTLGPRAKLELEAMKAIAADLPDDLDRTVTGGAATGSFSIPTGDTTYQADFISKDLTANKIGARCMRDHDGRPAVRDPVFLAETQIVPRPLADRVFKDAKAAGATQTQLLPNPDVPITLYTEAVATRKYGTHVYGTRTIVGAAAGPHAKFTNFSKPMSEYNKVAVDE